TTLASFEQDIILREQLPDPSIYQLNPKTTMTEIWTEFFDPPQPDVSASVVERATGDFGADQFLSFGAMIIGKGRAFTVTDDAAEPRETLLKQAGMPLIDKSWQRIDVRAFLIESGP